MVRSPTLWNQLVLMKFDSLFPLSFCSCPSDHFGNWIWKRSFGQFYQCWRWYCCGYDVDVDVHIAAVINVDVRARVRFTWFKFFHVNFFIHWSFPATPALDTLFFRNLSFFLPSQRYCFHFCLKLYWAFRCWHCTFWNKIRMLAMEGTRTAELG